MMKNQKMIKSYSELIKLQTFEERLQYLNFDGVVGEDTFGHDRYLNQRFYSSEEWRSIRRRIVARDNGCDLGSLDHEINDKQLIIVHHINPITKYDIINRTKYLTDPENLITTTFTTHNIIHYGNAELLQTTPIERYPNDTCPWKK